MLVRWQNRLGMRLLSRDERTRKTCPRCGRRTGIGAARCRGCRYRYPEKSGPRPAGLAMGAGFPLFLVGTLILLSNDIGDDARRDRGRDGVRGPAAVLRPALTLRTPARLSTSLSIVRRMRSFLRMLGFLRPFRRGGDRSRSCSSCLAIVGTVAIPLLLGETVDAIKSGERSHVLPLRARDRRRGTAAGRALGAAAPDRRPRLARASSTTCATGCTATSSRSSSASSTASRSAS